MKMSLKNRINRPKSIWVMLLVALVFGIGGFVAGTRHGGGDHAAHAEHGEGGEEQAQTWTCSMHPQIKQSEPGKCPLCAMDLIPLKTDEDGGVGARAMAMSPAAMKLADVRTAPVERRFVDIEIPLVGKVDYDETRVKTISAWVDGRLERLFVDYTGIPVKKGDHLVEIYSPELYSAQEELLQAIKTAAEVQDSDSAYLKKSAGDNVAAVREKLSLLGLKDQQIAEIETLKRPTSRVEIRSPISGIVIEKNAKAGMYVKTGTPICTVADLTTLWVKLDAYESDLAWIKYGQHVEIRTESYGDKEFKGWISFVDPVLNPETRTVKVRVLVDNTEGHLRPNMFVRATVKATVGQEGAVLAADMDDKWICPMHPEIVADNASDCSVCGMDLVKAETLGYSDKQATTPPLVLPSSAVLITGKRALVYVRLKGKDQPTFEGREISLGPRAGDFYIVRSGIREGDDVVINGNFKIDSALQLVAKPSMMSPVGGAAQPAHHGDRPTMTGMHEPAASQKAQTPAAFKQALTDILKAYYTVQKALASDDPQAAAAAAKAFVTAIDATNGDKLSGDGQAVWSEQKQVLLAGAERIGSAAALQQQRQALTAITAAAETLLQAFGPLTGLTVRKAFCPMVFDNKGAFWLQEDETISNPYFGDAMLRCGEIKSVLSEPTPEGDHHGTQ